MRLVDRHIGRRLCSLRLLKGLSQTALGAAAGVSFQQVQKYETGKNRISGSVMAALSRTLGVEPNFFFAGLPLELAVPLTSEPLSQPEVELLRVFGQLPPETQTLYLGLMRGGR